MVFNSFNFIILFPLIFLFYYVIPSHYLKARNVFLLAVSYLLYINWKPVYALILLGVTLVTFLFARWIENGKRSVKMALWGGTFDTFAPSVIQIL